MWPPSTAVFLGPVTCLPTVLFCGFFVSLSRIPRYLQWLTYMSYMRFSMEGVLRAVYGFDRSFADCTDFDDGRCPNPSLILSEMGVVYSVATDVGVLVLEIVVLRLLAFFALRFKLSRVR